MTKLDLQTPDFVAANAARLAEIFPNCVSETRNPQTGEIKRAIDFDLLRQELAYDIVEGPQERYRLDWPGKREALALANAPIRKTLRPCKEESVDFDNTRNLYIEGDNLDALKLLQETYLGKVKMIYIDPPYNTGNDFIYDDNFSISREEYQESSGAVDEEGNAMFDEEKWKQNSSASGRFHSEWLSMMYPRLKLARNLLSEDGVIFISIDEGECASLRKILDEVFGEANFLNEIIVENDSRARPYGSLASTHEYIIVYRKTEAFIFEELNDESKDFSFSDLEGGFDLYELRNRNIEFNSTNRPNLYYPFYVNPDSSDANGLLQISLKKTPGWIEVYPQESQGVKTVWRWGKEKSQQNLNTVLFGKPDSSGSGYRIFKKYRSTSIVLNSVWTGKEIKSDKGTLEVKGLFGGKKYFSFPKPCALLEQFLKLAAPDNSLVLDFFSGSATTAHAVMQLNAEDGGKRRHIMVQLPEPCDEKSEAFKAGFKTIAEIGKERIRRAGKKILEDWQAKQASSTELLKLETENSGATAPDVGFRVLKVASSNMADVYYQPDELTQDGLMLQVDNLKPGRNPEDLLFQVLLDWGVDLALPITEEKILKRRVFFVAENALAACFDTGLDEDFVKALAKRQPLRAVFRDSSYASDAVKINFEQIFKALSPHTELKTL
jgi:adenine-specific DNA-methyltransferase